MHELSLAQAMVEQVAAVAAREQATTVGRIVVRMGALSGVDREAFEFAFPIVAEDSVAADAELTVEEVPARVKCGDCGAETAPDVIFIRCESCGSVNVDVIAGREFTIKELEVE